MPKKVFAKFFSAAVLLAFLVSPQHPARAAGASVYFSPTEGTFQVGKIFSVNVNLSSPGQAMNAVSATIIFPSDKLEVVSLSKSGSLVNFWAQEPAFSNSSGMISFEGVISNPGYQGGGKKVLVIGFKAKAAGQAEVYFSSVQVLANDGLGTEISSDTGKARFSIGGAEVASPPSAPTGSGVQSLLVTSSTHPDSEHWYASNNPEFAWNLPSGAQSISFTANREPSAVPQGQIVGLKKSYTYTGVDEGLWYFHIRVRTAGGWGPVAHYKFQIDTQKPESLDVKQLPGKPADGKKIKFSVNAADKTSGIDHFELSTDGGPFLVWPGSSGVYEISGLSEGRHAITAKAVDRAGNFLTASIEAVAAQAKVQAPAAAYKEIADLCTLEINAIKAQMKYLILLLLVCLLILAVLFWRAVRKLAVLKQVLKKETGRAEGYLHEGIITLQRDIEKHIKLLKKATAKRELTDEESRILVQMTKDLNKIEYLIKEEITSIERAISD